MNLSTQRKAWKSSLALAISAVLLAGCNSGSSSSPNDDPGETPATVRNTTQGQVQGVETGNGYAFKGIPYATPPVGELRYTAPQPAPAWEGVLTTDAFGGSCIQPASTFGTEVSTEDCLYLNVYAPENADGLPVMVWIHGGAFETGSGDTYDPAGLIDEGVVVVTINYRLGVLGFLSHPALAAENDDGYSGNWGFMDQQLALQWVQDNIANFGGNTDNVTIFGESAGGLSVMGHVVSPASEGLFHKAIVQSGAYSGTQPDQNAVETGGDAFFSALECDDIACIRDLDVTAIQSAQAAGNFSFVPSLRPDSLPKSIGASLADNEYTKVPMIAGVNRDEWRLFVGIAELGRISALMAQGSNYQDAAAEASLKEEDYLPEIQSLLGVPEPVAIGIAAAYPLEGEEFGGNVSLALSALGTDTIFSCPGLGQISTLAEQTTVYGYEFNDRNAPSIIPSGNTFPLGAAHAFEIQYVFGSDESRADPTRTGGAMNEDQIELAALMTRAWAQFATTGNPNAETVEGEAWMEFSSGNSLIEFIPDGTTTLSEANFRMRHRCAT